VAFRALDLEVRPVSASAPQRVLLRREGVRLEALLA
jgi:hypothetical protein